MPGWKKKLTLQELKHLKDTGLVTTFKDVKQLARKQSEMRQTTPDPIEPCWICKHIMQKLNLPT